MNSSKALEIIYKELVRLKGKDQAAKNISTVMHFLFHELEESGDISSEAIQKALKEEAELCLANAKKDVA